MDRNDKILFENGASPLQPRMETRHGLVIGAAGAGKTASLKVLAESFSSKGVPVFLTDTECDLSCLSESYPVQFWDLYGQYGHPIRTTVSEMGAFLLARILDLNETQAGVLNIAFRIADEKGLLLLDMKDLRAILQYIGEHRSDFTLSYGNISKQTVGAILRSLISLEYQGEELFFGEPALDVTDWMSSAADGRGFINILHSVRLCQSPALYSTFLFWMLSELYETLPKTVHSDQPKLVLIISEARLLFRDTPVFLLDKIEQVIRLSRFKGISVYFTAETTSDLPPNILSLLEDRIEHSLAEPAEGCGCIDVDVRRQILSASVLNGKYDRATDRESAFEQLQERNRSEAAEKKKTGKLQPAARETRNSGTGKSSGSRGYTRQTPMEKAANAVFSTIGREVSRTLIRGILGSLKK